MSKRFPRLERDAQRGSKPRCHLLTNGTAEMVVARLTPLAASFATVSTNDRWMPQGFSNVAEAELDKAGRLLDEERRAALAAWWLPAGRRGALTPNFDIASTCTIEGKPGLLLVEAKAYDNELKDAAVGRPLRATDSAARHEAHGTIGAAVETARTGLAKATGLTWHISRDSHYQMSNRFAWSWKLTELGVPVVLVYLGLLRADEMSDKGKPFADPASWHATVMDHGRGLVPPEVWDRKWSVNGVPFIPLIRSIEQALDPEDGT